MEEFITYLSQFGNLNQQQIDLITSKATKLDLPKDNYFWEAGKIPKHIGFLVDGIIRVTYYDNQGEEITKYFFDENHLIKIGAILNQHFICKLLPIVNSLHLPKNTGQKFPIPFWIGTK